MRLHNPDHYAFTRNSGLRPWDFKQEAGGLKEAAQRVCIGVAVLFTVVCIAWGYFQ